MSIVTRKLLQDRIEDLYSAGSPSRRMGMAATPAEIRITDSVHISDAALQKYKQWKEENSAESIPKKQSLSTEVQDVKERFSVLDAPGAASMGDIRKAFISALKKYHPDKHYRSGAEALDFAENRTREILAAYEEIQKAYRSED